MARKPRLHVPGGCYHVILRGNGGQDIFLQNEDRFRLYLLLQEGVERFGHRIHAFCLMTNHLHLAVQVEKTPLSKILQNLSFRYTRWFNKKNQRLGHLFQGRYKAILVDRDAYLPELVRYIHLNPVRARMVEGPEEYPWSGHRAYIGKDVIPWLMTDWVLGQFAKRSETAILRYKKFVSEGMGEGRREEFHSGEHDPRVLGDETFTVEALTSLSESFVRPSLDHIVEYVCGLYGLSESDLAERGRARKNAQARTLVGWLALQAGSSTLSAVARRFGRDIATMSNAVRQMNSNSDVKDRARQILNSLYGQASKKEIRST